jgi:hypothetical protein
MMKPRWFDSERFHSIDFVHDTFLRTVCIACESHPQALPLRSCCARASESWPNGVSATGGGLVSARVWDTGLWLSCARVFVAGVNAFLMNVALHFITGSAR